MILRSWRLKNEDVSSMMLSEYLHDRIYGKFFDQKQLWGRLFRSVIRLYCKQMLPGHAYVFSAFLKQPITLSSTGVTRLLRGERCGQTRSIMYFTHLEAISLSLVRRRSRPGYIILCKGLGYPCLPKAILHTLHMEWLL